MTSNYPPGGRVPGSRSSSQEYLDHPPSYTNPAYAPTVPVAVPAQPAGYGRRFQPNSGPASHQPLYDEIGTAPVVSRSRSQSPARFLEQGVPPSGPSRSHSPGPYSRGPPAAVSPSSTNASYYGEATVPVRSAPGKSYSQKPYYPGYAATRYGRPKHKSVTREPGYYNLNTDTVVRAKKHKNKTFLYVGRPWTKGFSTTPRDFLPLAVVSLVFCPPVGLAALVFALLSRRSARRDDYSAAGYHGRLAFWLSVAAVIASIIFWIIIVAVINQGRFVGHRIH